MEKLLAANVLTDTTMNKDEKLTDQEYLLLDHHNSCSYFDMEMENKKERYASYYILAQLNVSKRFFDKNIVYSHANFDGPVLISRLLYNSMSFGEILAHTDNTLNFSRFSKNGHVYYMFDTDGGINLIVIISRKRRYVQYSTEFDCA